MGYFFIALFGGFWLLYKVMGEKKEARVAQRKYDAKWDKLDAFNNNYAAKEPMFCAMLNDGRITSDDIYERIEKELRIVFGNDYISKFPLPDKPGYNTVKTRVKKAPLSWKAAYDNVDWAWYIWLSKNGKVPQQFGLPTDWISLGVRQCFENEVPFEIINRNIEFCKIIENNLRENGAYITLVGMPGKHRENFLNGNSETRIAIYECLNDEDKQKSKRLW